MTVDASMTRDEETRAFSLEERSFSRGELPRGTRVSVGVRTSLKRLLFGPTDKQSRLYVRQPAARRWPRLALRSKNSAWLTTAETVAGWNGLAIRKAGSGRWPVRKRSG